VTTPPQFLSLSNPATAGTGLLSAPVTVPGNIEQLVTSVGPSTAGTAPVSFSTVPGVSATGPVSSFGNDEVVNRQIQSQDIVPACATQGGTQQNCQ
jgi:hypothetical protein